MQLEEKAERKSAINKYRRHTTHTLAVSISRAHRRTHSRFLLTGIFIFNMTGNETEPQHSANADKKKATPTSVQLCFLTQPSIDRLIIIGFLLLANEILCQMVLTLSHPLPKALLELVILLNRIESNDNLYCNL